MSTDQPIWDQRFEQLLRGSLPYLAPDEALPPDAELRDYGLDSIASVELLSLLENEFDVRLAEDDLSLATFRTPTVLWQALSAAITADAR